MDSWLIEFEVDVLTQPINELPFRQREPSPLLLEEVPHVAVTQLTDEEGTRQPLQPLPVGNCRSETVRIAVFLHQRVAS